jgi:predicted transposase YdaD
VLFARRALDPGIPTAYRAFEASGQVQRLYLQEQVEAGSLLMAVLQLVASPRRRVRTRVAAVLSRVEREVKDE